MAMIFRTACSVPGTPSSAPKGLEKRKLGTAAKIRGRKRKRAAARKESQGHVECGVQVDCAVTNMSEAAGAKVKRRKKAAGAKAKRAVGGLFSEAIRAAMAEITEVPVVTASTVSSVASGSRAAELAGRADIVTQDDIDTFVADEFREHGVDLTHAIDKDNFTIARRRGARVLEEVPIHNGLYIVVEYNHSLVGHAFVLSVQGKKGKTRQIFDLKDPKPVSSAMDWITFVACIRPFVVFKKK
ncbi:Hypothetical protein PHPALM_14658 [Phytophthora palmivora]|uniref:Uncharacterized protein n=1 Tax=Phytophthora palmivora TaxID=4796 RepID=A0A2P4XU61_9STRA|nr:Hypothetical protein PHPALM_14658 [Phytophthora palmivora]